MALATLVQGSTGPEVQNLQRALNFQLPEEMPRLVVDGIFGSKTRARLIAFQRRYDLKPDAIVGPKTQAALYSFVVLRPLLQSYSVPLQTRGSMSRLVGDKSLSAMPPLPPLRLPPFPGLKVPFPRNTSFPGFTLEIPSFPHFKLGVPGQKLDPQFQLWLRTRPFEVAAGAKMVFQKRSEDGGPGGVAFIEATVCVWSTPIIGEKFKAIGQFGVSGESRINDGDTETSLAGVLGVELKDVLTLGHVDILNLQLQAGFEKGFNKKPVDMTATVETGPTLETRNGRFVFQAGGFFQLKSNGSEYEVSGGPFVKGTIVF